MKHWHQHASQWDFVGHPLRPNAADIQSFSQLIAAHSQSSQQVAILGVTPEICAMPWAGQVYAIDKNLKMIREVWQPRNHPKHIQALHGDWQQLPFAAQQLDLVIGDGCFPSIPYPQGYSAILQEIRRILKPQGRLLMRFFVRPEQTESLENVFRDLLAAKIHSFHSLKWRIAMALHGDLDQGVYLHDVWQAWQDFSAQTHINLDLSQWRVEEIATINAYQNQDTYYHFPTLEEFRQITAHDFQELACHIPEYEIGERCPSLIFRPKV